MSASKKSPIVEKRRVKSCRDKSTKSTGRGGTILRYNDIYDTILYDIIASHGIGIVAKLSLLRYIISIVGIVRNLINIVKIS